MNTLEAWMGEKGFGDNDVAEKVGVSRVSVLRYRLGQSRPQPETAAKLQDLTGIPAWEFIKPAQN